nr:hypothetical protein [Gammaproteobacteria bacterium]
MFNALTPAKQPVSNWPGVTAFPYTYSFPSLVMEIPVSWQ